MSKHRTVERWVAYLDSYCGTEEPKVKCFPVQVIETKRQYRLLREDDGYNTETREAHKACGWKSTINKETNDCLFDTKRAAIVSLLRKYLKRSESARITYNRARIDCDKAKEAHAALYGEWE